MTMTGIAEIFIARLVVGPAGPTPESIKTLVKTLGYGLAIFLRDSAM